MKEDLEAAFERYFIRNMEAHVALLISANNEMSLDSVVKYVTPFRSPQLRKEFTEKIHDYSPYRLTPHNDEERQAEIGEMEKMGEMPQEQGGLSAQLRVRLAQVVERTSNGNFLCTGILKDVKGALQEVKMRWLDNSRNQVLEGYSKTEYLKNLIERIIEKFYKDNEEGIAAKIISYGAIDPVINQPLFAQDTNFREKFKTILYHCKTFQELRKYSGEDITLKRKELTHAISCCLIILQIDQNVAEEICNELLEKPHSNIVACRDDLTNKQKEKYYQSEFYRSGLLKKYAQICLYEQSIEFKVKEEISTILKTIEEQSRISKEIVECVINFKFFELLRVNSIRAYKRSIFEFVTNECPNYFKAFKMVKYQKRTPASLKENETLNLKMELIDVFCKIKLPFEEWQNAQDKIMNRNYRVVDELTLKLDGKSKLVQHICAQIEPYFHQQEKEMSYRSEIEQILLKELMATDISELNFDKIFNIVSETLDSQNFMSESVDQLNRGDQRAYRDVLNNAMFKEYVENRRRDVKQEQYQREWQLRKQIYENNFEDRISVSYAVIDDFVLEVIKNGGKCPPSFADYVTDLKKLKLEGEPLVAEQPSIVIPPQPQQSQKSIIPPASPLLNPPVSPLKPPASLPPVVTPVVSAPVLNPEAEKARLNEEFSKESSAFYAEYVKTYEASNLEKVCNEKFGANSANLIESIIKNNAFQKSDSAFFTGLGYNNLILRRVKGEFEKNKAMGEKLKRAGEILGEMERFK